MRPVSQSSSKKTTCAFGEFGRGQKTGFYLDQRENRTRVAAYCNGARVLNVFSYSGAFAVYALAAGATHVVNVIRVRRRWH